MVEAAAAGCLPNVFWDLTYRELTNLFVGQSRRMTREHKRSLFGAWHTANLTRGRKMPRLSDLLQKLEPLRVMSAPVLREQLIAMVRGMGGKITTKKRGE